MYYLCTYIRYTNSAYQNSWTLLRDPDNLIEDSDDNDFDLLQNAMIKLFKKGHYTHFPVLQTVAVLTQESAKIYMKTYGSGTTVITEDLLEGDYYE